MNKNIVKRFTEDKIQKLFLEEYFRKQLDRAEYGGMEYETSMTQGTRIVLKVGRVGYAIGKKGRTIKKLQSEVKELLGTDRLTIEVDSLKDPELNPHVMAQKLASSLERGRHFRRTAYGTVRRIMGKGAVGVEIIVSGKVTSQRARVEKFRDGFIARTGDPKRKFLRIGRAIAKIKRGTLGVTVSIMDPDTDLPDQMEIISEPTHTTMDIPISDGVFDPEEFGEIDHEDEAISKTVTPLTEEDLEEFDLDDDIPEEAGEDLEEDLEDLDIE